MKKLILFILILTVAIPVMAQQLNHTWGLKETSGDAWDGDGITFIDTTTGTTNVFIFDINDFSPGFDINPLVSNDVLTITGSSGDTVGVDSIYGSTTSTTNINSDRFYLGTFYAFFNNEGVKAPATDSLKYTVAVYPGVYADNAKSVASIEFGTAVTLETIATAGDYMSINNVYLHATKYKHYPPEVIKIVIAPTGGAKSDACDDSTHVSWDFVYPAIYQIHKERR